MTFQIIQNFDAGEYHRSEGVSSHDLGYIGHSLAYYRYKKSQPPEKKDAYDLGTLLHTAALEPDRFEDSFILAPECSKQGNANKQRWAEAQVEADRLKKILVKKDDLQDIRLMAASVRNHPAAAAAIKSGGMVEASVYATDPETGILLRARPDVICPGNAVVDIKTTVFGGGSEYAFGRTIGKFRYAEQAAFYQDILKLCGMEKTCFVFIVVEKEPPYAVAVYQLDDASIEAGRKQYRKDLATYKAAVESGKWGAYSDEIQIISAPQYKLNAANEIETTEEEE